jgi:hypothetical protein
VLGWVTAINGGVISVVKKDGSFVNGTYNLKIIRSGKRNNLTLEMATLTSLSNPLTSLSSNAYQNVLQASAVEYSIKRKTHCNCIEQNSILPNTTNPYITGTKGTWRPLKNYTHLTTRSQSNINNNTNIRKDGMFESYTPFYKLTGGNWQMDEKDWTHASEVTEFNVFGQEVENKDALNRYSSATFGYNQTAALSVAANAAQKEQGFDGFEDYAYNPCVDDHFKFLTPDTVTTEAHTGRYSLKVSSGTPKYLHKQLAEDCTPESSSCDLNVTTGIWLEYQTIIITGGTAPYSIDSEVISGGVSHPTVVHSNNRTYIEGIGPYVLEITVTDAKGCIKTIIVPSYNYGH